MNILSKVTDSFSVTQKLSKKKLIIFGIAGTVAVSLIIILFVVLTPRYDVSKYVTFTCSGYNGAGEVTVKFNTAQFVLDFNKENPNKKISNDITVNYNIDSNGEFYNSDIAKVRFNCSENIRLKNMKYTVSELDEPKAINPFDGVEVMFYGANGQGSCDVITENCLESIQRNVEFTVTPDNGKLSNGDTITITATNGMKLISEGYVLSETNKQYTVKDLFIYPTSMTGIDCNDSNDYMSNAILDYIQVEQVYLDWDYNQEMPVNWYLLGDFDLEYVVTPMAYYYAYTENNPQENTYYGIYKAQIIATCDDVYKANTDDKKNAVKSIDLKEGSKFTGTIYFTYACNRVYALDSSQVLVLPPTADTYDVELYGKSYFVSDKFATLEQAKNSITRNEEFDTVIAVN